MIDKSLEPAIRAWMAVRCRDPMRRTDGRKMDMAHRWQPSTVRHPEFPGFFSDAGAWDFIADCLEDMQPINQIPPTAEFPDFAIYMVHLPSCGGKRIYIKLAVRESLDMIIGISFHYSSEEYRS